MAGHIHEDAGVTWQAWRGGAPVAFINAATCDLRYKPTQPPIVFTLRRDAAGAVTAHVAGHEPPRALLQQGDESPRAEDDADAAAEVGGAAGKALSF